ncbi:hypothetical protein Z517_11759 [Fonsecaea pedrosoi CBS 271.37]|uniref:Mid2 domain-containing protein n=1 Tax=Fonsecaea pedrosoi CBS 271.37 TaxID=1442368 RepID=A0A0D2G2L5_9EURO|nr:uncharacterized protein Z517_11759 [Fonsecaea pedrosoi CBS 271.37]KIW74988.1 hypothetical protein Z517_11759 [Fonsecaea pedrosoi CBS 271.37]
MPRMVLCAETGCDTGKNAVKLGDSQPSTVTVIGSTSWPGISSTTSPFTQTSPLVTEGTSTSDSDSLTESTTSSTEISSTPTSSPTTTTTSGPTTAAGASATSNTPEPSRESGGGGSSNTGLAAGLGAGLGAAAVIIGVLIFVLFRKRRHSKAMRAHLAANGGHGGSGGGSLLDQDQMMQKPFVVASQPGSLHVASEAPTSPAYPRPELAGAGEYDRAEMPAGLEGDGLHHRRSTERAELGS